MYSPTTGLHTNRQDKPSHHFRPCTPNSQRNKDLNEPRCLEHSSSSPTNLDLSAKHASIVRALSCIATTFGLTQLSSSSSELTCRTSRISNWQIESNSLQRISSRYRSIDLATAASEQYLPPPLHHYGGFITISCHAGNILHAHLGARHVYFTSTCTFSSWQWIWS